MKHKRLVTALATVATVCAALPAFAGRPEYLADPDTQLARGIVNVATGWVEVPKQSLIGGQNRGGLGLVGGFFKGVGLGAARTLVGGYEIATFWALADFEPLMQPATVLGGR
jgi:putative exosortase-associated protein (TIGR04073 family)